MAIEQRLAAASATRLPEVGLRHGFTERVAAVNTGLRGVAAAAALPSADAPVWAALLGAPALDSAEFGVLFELVRARSVPSGQTVFTRGSAASTLVAVRSGEVALGVRTADGLFRTERVVRGPAWLDLSAALAGDGHACDALAQTAANVLELPSLGLQARLAELPELTLRLLQRLAGEVQAQAANTHELMHKDAPGRLAQWLLQRCEPVAEMPGQAVVRLAERKRDVASQLAITPETLSRLMRSFARQGVIEVAGYTLRVLDIAALALLAQG